MTEQEALVALNMMQGVGSMTVLRVMERFGSAAAFFDLTARELTTLQGVGSERAARIVAERGGIPYQQEIERAAGCRVTLVTLVDEDYPDLLRKISDPPPVLYVAGNPRVLKKTGCAVIGTRHATLYGKESARRFGYQLAAAGYSVISGFARGIDTEAHAGAVQAGGVTVAVLGSALDRMYPQENKQFAREIVEKGGAIITEYPFGREADRQTFPQRNRIVSGLSRGVLVIESPLKSGTLITVAQALEQGRTVMAVPGRIDSTASMGSNRLIREGARLVSSVDDVLEELQDLFADVRMRPRGGGSLQVEEQVLPHVQPGKPQMDSQAPETLLTGDERKVLVSISDEGSYADTIVRESGLEPGKVNSILVSLQIKRVIKVYPGGLFKRLK
ncbi:MAG: DNA-processing protein DprA [Kiritimatiellae bacterium]|nr:DNA-processing protein DprA [Kiritimatiellia bacterium]